MDNTEKWDSEGDGDSTGVGHKANGGNKRKGQRREKPVQGEERVGAVYGAGTRERRVEDYRRRGKCRRGQHGGKEVNTG